MKILTLNTWQHYGPWHERWQLILHEVKKINPDVIGFQEVFDEDWVECLKAELTDYSFYHPAPVSGLLTLCRGGIAESGCLRYKTQSSYEDKERFAIKTFVRKGTQKLEIFNTHLSWRPYDAATRQNQAQELADWCRSSKEGCAVFAVGDFNAECNSTELRPFTENEAFLDFGAVPYAQIGNTWSHRNPYTLEERNLCDGVPLAERRIDFIFGRNLEAARLRHRRTSLVFDQSGPGGIWPSDHFGVLVELEQG